MLYSTMMGGKGERPETRSSVGGKPTKAAIAERQQIAESIAAALPVAQAHFDSRRAALNALEAARESVTTLVSIGGYSREALMEALSYVCAAGRIVSGMSPLATAGAAEKLGAMLSDSGTLRPNDPYFATWADAEPAVLDRMFGKRDNETNPFAFKPVDPNAVAIAKNTTSKAVKAQQRRRRRRTG